MPKAQTKGKGGSKKIGRNMEKCARYRSHGRREKNKIKRVLQSCGLEFAIEWAKKYGVALPKKTLSILK